MSPGFSNRLVRIRNDKSQTEFADYLGIEQTHISRYENDKAKPGFDFLKILSEKTNVNLNWLLTGEGDMYVNGKSESELSKENRELKMKLQELESNISAALRNLTQTKPQSKKKRHTTINNYRYSLN